MSDPTVISIDAMGGDFGPPVIVAGLAGEVDAWRAKGVRFLLHGDEAQIEAELARKPAARELCEVQHADKVIASDEKPAQAVRRRARICAAPFTPANPRKRVSNRNSTLSTRSAKLARPIS